MKSRLRVLLCCCMGGTPLVSVDSTLLLLSGTATEKV